MTKGELPEIIGHYQRGERLGEGGMGAVWKGIHAGTHEAVALKLVRLGRNKQQSYRRFLREVHALARLDHPAIVQVLDYGVLDSTRRRGESTPWIAMELADDSLAGWQGLQNWETLRNLLDKMLGALAHGHARGVLHRDLKPANVLVIYDGEDTRFKLTDFGIAWVQTEGLNPEASLSTAGTPAYMAPEQFDSRWRDYGPWTDLYALGCMAWELVTGAPPFKGGGIVQLAFQHMTSTPPALRPLFPVPADLENWLLTLLAKRPPDRFRYAADARHALVAIPDHPLIEATLETTPDRGKDEAPRDSRPTGQDTVERSIVDSLTALDDTMASLNEGGSLSSLNDGGSLNERGSLLDADVSTRPELLPTADEPAEATDVSSGSWNRLVGGSQASLTEPSHLSAPYPKPRAQLDETALATRETAEPTERRSHSVVHTTLSTGNWMAVDPGPGLNLFGLREGSFEGRKRERAALLKALLNSRQNDALSVVVVRGGGGMGRTRLLSWFCRTVHELGGGHPIFVSHGPTDAPFEPLARALAGHLLCHGLNREEAWKRISATLQHNESRTVYTPSDLDVPFEDDAAALTALLEPMLKREGRCPGVSFANDTERFLLVARYLRRMERAERRPIVVAMDDVHWSEESVRLAQTMLSQHAHRGYPVVLVLSADRDAGQNVATDRLSELTSLESVVTVEMEPLTSRAARAIVASRLPLPETVADTAVAHAGANPLFILQLLADWVEGGKVVSGDAGQLSVSDDIINHLPDDLDHLWQSRLARILGEDDDIWWALMLAAALGMEVSEVRWHRAAVERVPAAVLESLLDRLSVAGLAEATDRGWRFTFHRLRRSLVALAHRRGLWRELNRCCVDAMPASPDPEVMANHLIHCGQDASSLEYLLRASRRAQKAAREASARVLLDRYQAALERLGASGHDERLALLLTERARLAVRSADFTRAVELASEAKQLAEQQGWNEVLVRALLVLAFASDQLGEHAQMTTLAGQAALLCEELDAVEEDEPLWLEAMRLKAQAALELGRLDAAELWYGQVVERSGSRREETVVDTRISALRGLARVYRRKGDIAAARKKVAAAEALCLEHGNRYLLCMVQNTLAELDRLEGKLESAESRYRRAIQLAKGFVEDGGTVPSVNLALVRIARNDYAGAVEIATPLVQRTSARGQGHMELFARSAQLPGIATTGSPDHIAEALDKLEALSEKMEIVDAELDDLLWLAARLLNERGLGDLAERASEMANGPPSSKLARKV